MADDGGGDLASLHKKLETYTKQMGQVEALLQSDPGNQEWAKLKNDLSEVIGLTNDFIRVKMQQNVASRQSAGGQAPAAPAAGAPPPPPPPTSAAQTNWEPAAGASCEAMYDKRWYPVMISAVHEENQYTVVFFTHGNSEVIDGSQLRALQGVNPRPVDRSSIQPGQTCQARFAADGKWYTARVDELTDRGVKVTFPDYGNSEEVPIEWFRFATVKQAAPVKAKHKKDKLKLIAIPDSLQILPTDTEAEKKRKYKRIKMIKTKNKAKINAAERKKQQSSWLKFHKKTKGKRIRGSMNSVRKKSIFASPDSLDGRVGVTGSGQGMTDFQQRKKYRLNQG